MEVEDWDWDWDWAFVYDWDWGEAGGKCQVEGKKGNLVGVGWVAGGQGTQSGWRT